MQCFFWGDSIVADRAIINWDDVVVLVSGEKNKTITEKVGKIIGRGNGGYILIHSSRQKKTICYVGSE